MVFNPSGAFDTIVTLSLTFNSLGFHCLLLFRLSSDILGLLLSFLWGLFSTSWPLNGGGLQSSDFRLFCFLPAPPHVVLFNYIPSLQWQISAQNDSSVHPTVWWTFRFGCLKGISNLILFSTILFMFLLKLLFFFFFHSFSILLNGLAKILESSLNFFFF